MKNNKIANDIEDLYPLSDIQKGMVYHSLIDPSKFIYYTLSINYVKFKDFDAGIFKKAFELMAVKHSMLRTGFNMYDFEEQIQMVHKHIAPDITHYDIAGLDSWEQQAYLKTLIDGDKQKPFNINSGEVLWKVRTLNLGNDNICLIWISHHAVMDGWSSASLMTEVKNTYLRLIENPNFVPPKLKNTYKAFVVEQIIERKKKENVEFWQRELEDYRRIHFPGSGPHLNNNGVRNTISKDLGEDLAVKLKQTAQKFNTSLKHLCFGAYAYMLNMFSYENDLVVGLISNSRPSCPDGDKIIGCFLNTIPVRIKIPSLLRWGDYIRLIETKLLELKKYDKFSFLEIVKNIGEIQHGQNPILDTIFNYMDFHIYDQMITKTEIVNAPFQKNLKNVSIEDTVDNVDTADNYSGNVGGIGGTHTLFDCSITATGGGFRVVFNFDTGSIDSYCVAALCLYFEKVLHKFAEEADDIVKKEDLLSDEEKQRILFEFNNTAVDFPKDKTIPQLFMEQTAKMPDFIAIVGNADVEEKKRRREEEKKEEDPFGRINAFGGVQLSYRELNDQSDRLAGLLIEKVIQPDTIVAIMIEPSVGMIIGIMGILKTGGAYLPIDPDYPQERIDYMLKDSGAKLLAVAKSKEGEKVRRWEREEVLLEDIFKSPKDSSDLLTLLPSYHLNPSNPAYVIYTSGTTGKPKGVLIENRSLANYAGWFSQKVRLTSDDSTILTSSFGFDLGYTSIYPSLLSGSGLHIVPKDIYRSSDELIGYILRHHITYLKITPSLFNVLVQDDGYSEQNLRSLKLIVLGGEPIKVNDVQKSHALCRHIQIMNHYGPTETTIGCAAQFIDFNEFHLFIQRPTIGYPIANMKIFIFDKGLNFLPVGVPGELYIFGMGVGRGYINHPELTAEKFRQLIKEINKSFAGVKGGLFQKPSPFAYKTGDMARWTEKGTIEFLGRSDNQVKIRGFRVELGEIESRLLKYKDIKNTVVLAVEMPDEKYLCAYIVSNREYRIAKILELKETLAQELPDYMIPPYFVQVEKIPLTPNGKVDRGALPKPEWKAGEQYVAPRDDTERKLVDLWADILNIKSDLIGIDSNFFQLGGHSLKSMILAARIHKEFNVNVLLADIFKMPKLKDLAAYIKRKKNKRYIAIEPAEEKEYYELASAQKRLYVLQQMNPDSVAYNMLKVIPLPGFADLVKIAGTFKKLIERHESLRTTFFLVDGQPVQKIQPTIPFEIETLQPGPLKDVFNHFIRPFDLSRAPLLRAGLVRDPDGRNILLLDMHHIISDGVSHQVLLEDFQSLFSGAELQPLRIQYKDFSEWQNSEPGRKNLKGQGIYWLKEYEGELPVLALPADYPRPAAQSFAGAELPFALDANEVTALKNLAATVEATLFMVLLVMYNILLARLGGSEDIIVGTPVAGRRHSDLEKIIGMFVNTLALRNYPAGEKTFPVYLQEIKERTLAAFENQDYPFEELVDQLEIVRDVSRNPLFDVMFNYMVADAGNGREADETQIQESQKDFNNSIAKFDLTLTGVENNGKIFFLFQYAVKLFKEETIQRFSIYFKKIAAAVVKEPGIRIQDIEIISEAEKKQILSDFNDTAAEYPKDKRIHQLFAEQAAQTPDAVALFAREKREKHEKKALHITYFQLNKQSDRLAGMLIEKGVQADIIVAIMIERSIEMIIGILGILKAGGAYLPIDPEYPQERIDYMLKDSGTKLLAVANDQEGEKVRSWEGEKVYLEEIFNSTRISSYHLTFLPSYLLNSSNLAYVIYTSGTTGLPKGSLIEHRNVVRLLFNDSFQFDFSSRDVWTLFHSFCFDFSVWEMYGALLYGGKLMIIPKMMARNTEAFTGLLTKEVVTVLNQTPSAFYNLIGEALSPHRQERELYLKYIIFGGEPLNPIKLKEWREKFPKTRLINMFGITETTVHVTYKEIKYEEIESNISNIGKPIPTLSVYILDKYLKPVPIGVTGEICVGGKGVCRGYLNRVDLIVGKFIENPFKRGDRLYRSGDVGQFLENGDIEYLSRIDQQVKIRGFRIELGEIENQLLKHEKIKEAVVILEKNTDGDKYLAAYFVSNGDIPVEILREHLANDLPDYMIPSYFVRLGKIPLTSNGKINKSALPKPELKVSESYIAPRDEIEKELVKLWSDVLSRDGLHASQLEGSIGIHDNFFHLGGHSLKATVLVSKIHKVFHVKVPLTEIFKTPTIRNLSNYIKTSAKEKYLSIEPVEKKEDYSLSSAQKRLYILYEMDHQGIGYNIPSFLVLEGVIDKERLKHTFRQLIHRHESLRTSFHMINDEPLQKIHDNVEFEIEQLDGRGDPAWSPFIRWSPGIIRNFIRPFDLSKAPLLRVGLLKENEVRHILMVDMHHIISDGTSTNILVKDFMALYQGQNLVKMRLQYKDFSVWQKDEKQAESLKRQEEYWLNEFAGEIPVLELPTDYPRPVVQSFEGNRISFELDKETTGVLKALTLKTGATLYMLLLTLYTIFLSKGTGQEEIIIGSPTAGRRHTDLAEIIGIFVNTLAFRNYPSGEKKFTDFLEEVKEKTLKAFENQDYQYEDLVEKVALTRDTSRNPLFATMFILQNIENAEINIPGLKLSPYTYENKTAKFDLTLTAVEMEEKLVLNFEYCTKLFKEETANRFITYFKNVVNGIIENKDRRISDFEIITEEEKKRILVDFNNTEVVFLKDKTIHQLFAEQASKTPDYVAVIGHGQTRTNTDNNVGADLRVCPICLTYSRLDEQSDQLTGLLINKGVLPDTIVGIMTERSIEMIIGIMGILKAGGAYLPIDPEYPQERIEYMLKDSNSKVLIINKSEIRNPKFETNPNDQNTNIPNKNFGILFVLNLNYLNFDIVSDFDIRASNFLPSNLAYIIYTSGSTGTPKGVMIEHRSVVNRLNWMQKAYPIDGSDVILQKTTYTFDVSVWELFWWSFRGASVNLLAPGEEKDPAAIVRALATHCITTMHFVPSMLNAFLDYLEKDDGAGATISELRPLRQVFASGEALNPAQMERFYHLFDRLAGLQTRLINLYGPTEATVDVSYFNCSAAVKYERIPIGKPIDNINLFILDKNCHLQPIGIVGELHIAGIGLARGYLNRPELTRGTFEKAPLDPPKLLFNRHSPITTHQSPIYKTGDLVRWLKDGNIEYLGRIDHQVKVRGFRIELGEIENRLIKDRKVKDALVIPRESSYLCAYIVPAAPDTPNTLSISELRDYLSLSLPVYMIPSYFMIMDKMPLTSNGKINRHALPKPQLESGESYIAPRDALEKKLVEIWSDVLHRNELNASQMKTSIGIDDNFFHIGGHSLKATIMMSKIHKELNVKVELMEIFRTPTIRDIARLIKGLKKEAFQAIEPVEKKEYYPLSSAQKRLYFLQQLDLSSTGYNMPMVLPIGKEIKKEKLEFALKQLIVRHESLRTCFQRVNNEVVQRVHEQVEFELEKIAAKNAKGREEKLGDRQEKDVTEDTEVKVQHSAFSIQHSIRSFIRPFDLSQAPLMRSGLIEMPDGDHVWIVDIHHIVSDGTSHMVLKEDFTRLYETGVPLEPLPLQYKDFAQWQNELFAEGRIKSQEDYWLQLYAGEIPRLNLAADFKRPEVFTFQGDQYGFQLEGEESAKFKILGARYGGTLYMNMMAVLNALFYKYTGQTDIIIGSVIAGRRHADIQGVVGMFVNTLAMRNYPSGEKNYENFLWEVIANSVGGFENQDVQFEELVEKLDPERDPSRNPLFDIAMVVQNFKQAHGNIQLEIKNEYNPGSLYQNRTAKFDLAFFVSEFQDDMDISIQYYTGIFKKETIERLVDHFQNIIKAVIKNPTIAIKDIDILSEKEKEQVLYEFNNTGMEFPKDKTIHGLISEQAAKKPGTISLIYNDQMLSYRELERQADSFARYLCQDKKIALGEPVGVWIKEPMYRQIALMGILKAGGAFVPLDPATPTKRIKYIIDDSRAGVVISDQQHLRDLNRLQWECPHFHSYLCIDSMDIYAEEEQETNQMMDQELWHHVGESATDDITGGGWLSSYTGLPFSREEMDEYGDNILKKLEPLLHPAMKVLEIGCASGISMFRLAPKVGLYYGTDLSEVIIEKNKKIVQEKSISNIELSCLAAHEIEQIPVKDFDLVIINSVIQCFHGHNYLRHVLQKAVSLLKDSGYLFIGDVMDQEKKKDLVKELTAFKEANRGKGYTTKTDFSAELFVSKGYWQDLEAGWSEIESLTFSDKLFTIENELTKFRYDVLIKVNKHGEKEQMPKLKYQDDMRAILPVKCNWPGRIVSAHDLAYIIYTSGSTGKPKGVMVEHRNVVRLVKNTDYITFSPRDRLLPTGSVAFDIMIFEIWGPLCNGVSLSLASKDDILNTEKLQEVLVKHDISILHLIPQLFNQLAASNIDLFARLRYFLVGGDKVSPAYINALRQKYTHLTILHMYGPTENTTFSTFFPVEQNYEYNIPIGKPIANSTAYIMDKFGHLQPIGVMGELCVGGEGIARGYLNNPELTANRFKRNVISQWSFVNGKFQRNVNSSNLTNDQCPMTNDYFYSTGDLARWLPNGNIEFLGRIDHQVKIRGYRVELGEIENRLLKMDGIDDAAVVVREKDGGDKYICAYFVSGREYTTAELRDALARELPYYMIPAYFLSLESIPLTATGKIDKQALPEPGIIKGAGRVLPTNETEKKLIEIWAGLLGRDNAQIESLCASIGIEDNFFDLGGHSLMAVNLIAKIQKVLGAKISLAGLFKNPTIRKIAESIKQQDINGREQEEYAVIDPVEKKEYYPLSAIQRGLFLQQQLDGENITYNISQFYPIKEKLDPDRISTIFQAITQRHESLRTSFRVINDQPVQIIHDPVAFKLVCYEIKPGIETLQTGIMQEFIRPFDLEGPSQFRAGLIQHETGSILMIDTHHIIFDGRSDQILIAEFIQLYHGRELAPLILQYKDFAAWQNRLSESEEMAKQERYWLKQFENGIPELNLPLDYERPPVQSFEGSSMDFAIDAVETRALARLAREEKLTMNMVLLAVVHIWLSKICSQETAIIGISAEGRKHADLQHIIGMFVNTLVIISQPGSEKTLRDYFLEMKEKTLAALDNQDYQYEELVRKVLKKRKPGRNPLVDLVFAFNAPNSSLENNEKAANPPDTTNEEPGMNLESLSEEKKRAKFDLNLLGSEMGGHLFFNLVYCTKLFKRETIEIFTGYFKKIVSFIIKEENRNCLLKDIILTHTLAESKDDFSRDDYVDFDF